MYAIVRRYTPKANIDQKDLDQFTQRLEEKFLPITKAIRGFHSYYVVNAGNREILSISVFEDKAGATESTRRAAEFVSQDELMNTMGSPQISEGEVLMSQEAPVGAR